jgi:hypothetical protein
MLTTMIKLQGYWALAIAIPLGIIAYEAMFRLARSLENE